MGGTEMMVMHEKDPNGLDQHQAGAKMSFDNGLWLMHGDCLELMASLF